MDDGRNQVGHMAVPHTVPVQSIAHVGSPPVSEAHRAHSFRHTGSDRMRRGCTPVGHRMLVAHSHTVVAGRSLVVVGNLLAVVDSFLVVDNHLAVGSHLADRSRMDLT